MSTVDTSPPVIDSLDVRTDLTSPIVIAKQIGVSQELVWRMKKDVTDSVTSPTVIDSLGRQQPAKKPRKGGLSEYAEKIGKTQQYVSQLRDAAEVFGAVKGTSQLVGLLDKAQHLAAIHKAERRRAGELLPPEENSSKLDEFSEYCGDSPRNSPFPRSPAG